MMRSRAELDDLTSPAGLAVYWVLFRWKEVCREQLGQHTCKHRRAVRMRGATSAALAWNAQPFHQAPWAKSSLIILAAFMECREYSGTTPHGQSGLRPS